MDTQLQLLAPAEHVSVVEKQVQNLKLFLEQNGLPYEGIIAPIEDRKVMWQNLPDLLEKIPVEAKADAKYLARFVVGSGLGLFDYSLNSIWNEVVVTLHKVVVAYGLDIFFDKAVGTAQRSFFKTEEDLGNIKDRTMLDTCMKLELITKTTHKKLAHILDMRNDIGISHPNEVQINAYELLGWVTSCINEVLLGRPSDEAIQVRSLIVNLKSYGQIIDQAWIDKVGPQMKSLPTRHCDSLLRTFFALYVDPETDATLQKNISMLAPIIWPLATDDEKNRLGMTLTGYNNNLKRVQHERGSQFFDFVKGNNHRAITERIFALDRLVSRLKNAHYSYNNYYHEAVIMEEIMTYIASVDDIPPQVVDRLLQTVVLCRIGRGLTYENGVSQAAKPYYDQLLEIAASRYTPQILAFLSHAEPQRKMEKPIAHREALAILPIIHRVVIDARQKEGVEYLMQKMPTSPGAIYNKEFKLISSPYINW